MAEVIFMFEEFPTEFSSVLKQNFCAMKYVAGLSDKKRLKLAKRVENMDKNQMRRCVSELSKRVF